MAWFVSLPYTTAVRVRRSGSSALPACCLASSALPPAASHAVVLRVRRTIHKSACKPQRPTQLLSALRVRLSLRSDHRRSAPAPGPGRAPPPGHLRA
eukprot:226458-Prymnesium_polylepis.2